MACRLISTVAVRRNNLVTPSALSPTVCALPCVSGAARECSAGREVARPALLGSTWRPFRSSSSFLPFGLLCFFSPPSSLSLFPIALLSTCQSCHNYPRKAGPLELQAKRLLVANTCLPVKWMDSFVGGMLKKLIVPVLVGRPYGRCSTCESRGSALKSF